jgi:hypothetical protein
MSGMITTGNNLTAGFGGPSGSGHHRFRTLLEVSDSIQQLECRAIRMMTIMITWKNMTQS